MKDYRDPMKKLRRLFPDVSVVRISKYMEVVLEYEVHGRKETVVVKAPPNALEHAIERTLLNLEKQK